MGDYIQPLTKVPPRIELGLRDSKSRVITTTLWDHIHFLVSFYVWPNDMSLAGFEPALPKETDLKSVALDHSAKETKIAVSCFLWTRSTTELHFLRNDRNWTCDNVLIMHTDNCCNDTFTPTDIVWPLHKRLHYPRWDSNPQSRDYSHS